MFKSREVNTDPVPWKLGLNAYGYGLRQSTRGVGPDWEYAPRPEFAPTRDPQPWEVIESAVTPAPRFAHYHQLLAAGHFGRYNPRREEFDTPVNPALVWLRAIWDDPKCGTRAEILDYMLNDPRMIDARRSGFTPEVIDHAHRVIARLIALSAVAA